MHTNHRPSGFVRFQQELARGALRRGGLESARVALRVLQIADFAGGAAVSEGALAVLRDPRASYEDTLAAVQTLIELGAAGGR